MDLTESQIKMLKIGVSVFLGLVVIGIITVIIVSKKKAAEKKAEEEKAAEQKAAEQKVEEEKAPAIEKAHEKAAEKDEKAIALEKALALADIIEIIITRTDVANNDPNKKNIIKMPSSYFLKAKNGDPPIEGCWSILDVFPTSGITCNNSTILLKLSYNIKATPLLADKNGNFICSRDITDTRPQPADIQAGGKENFDLGICGFKFTKTNDSPNLQIVDNTIRIDDNRSIMDQMMNPRRL